MRFVAVPVDDDDVPGRAQCLDYNLVRRRGAVRREINAVCPERTRGELLRGFDVAGRFQKAVEPTGGCGRFSQEDVGAVELSHVANPIRVEDGLPSRDWKCV